jgi:hypothetical protein
MRREPDSNNIDESDLHFAKQDEPKISTPHGIIIDCSAEYENAFDPIRDNRECNSNEIDRMDRQFSKHEEPRISTVPGRRIE